jgi:hypothetical protein
MINPEHHQLVLQRLGKTIELAKTLKEEQFDYSSLVAKYDFSKKCGTVCCIIGHYPNWGIEGFKYDDSPDFHTYKSVSVIAENFRFLEYGIAHYHTLSISVIYYLFFGSPFFGSCYNNEDHDIFLSLNEVIARFEEIYQLVLTDKLDNSLYYVP